MGVGRGAGVTPGVLGHADADHTPQQNRSGSWSSIFDRGWALFGSLPVAFGESLGLECACLHCIGHRSQMISVSPAGRLHFSKCPWRQPLVAAACTAGALGQMRLGWKHVKCTEVS